MTPDAPDMSTPVTRGELREELAQLDQKFKQWLEIWGGALLSRIDETEQRLLSRIESTAQCLNQRIESTAQRLNQRIDETAQCLNQRIESTEQRLLVELARHTSAVHESMTAQIGVIDEKYADLPARVHQLEDNGVPLERR